MLNLILFIVFGVFMFNLTDAQRPGARVILTSKSLNYVSSLMIPLLQKKLSEFKVPDISDKTKSKIGKIKYTISNIHFKGFSISSSTISSSTNGITLQLSNIALNTECKWKYKRKHRPHIGHHGRAEIKVKHSGLKLTASVTKKADGHPVMKVTNCEVDLHLSIKVHGHGSWLYKLFKSKLERELKSTLKSQICAKIHATTTEWNTAITSYPMSKKVKDFAVTYGLLKNPVFSSNQIQLDLEGNVITTVSGDTPLQSSIVLPAVESTDKMIHLLLTDKFFATGVMATIHSGLLHYTINPDQLSSKFKLNTLFFKPVIPKLFKQFPNMPVALGIDITKYKEIYLDLAGIHISLLGDLSLQVIQESETSFEAFSVELELHCTVEADILQPNDKPAVVLEATDLQITLGKLTSSIGDFQTASLEQALDGMSFLLMPIINEYGRKGFAIPNMDKVTLLHPSITLKKDCMQISADFKCLL